MAFHPDYPAVPEVFLSLHDQRLGRATDFMRIGDFALHSRQRCNSPGAGTVEQTVIIEVDQFASNHNGGDIGFRRRSAMLYIGLGDGGGGGDPQETGTGHDQPARLDACVLMSSVQAPATTIPAEQPVRRLCEVWPDTESNANQCPEIYAWGLRNPWRWSFDAAYRRPLARRMWDKTPGRRVDRIQINDRNYGWDCREGAQRLRACRMQRTIRASRWSIISHANGNVSITGGHLSIEGTSIPGL